jgi:hypothetical protein
MGWMTAICAWMSSPTRAIRQLARRQRQTIHKPSASQATSAPDVARPRPLAGSPGVAAILIPATAATRSGG